uniref:hypothetical protein n=1 Tax=Vibrio cholerae TaxID=666 RepID=UPI003F58A773
MADFIYSLESNGIIRKTFVLYWDFIFYSHSSAKDYPAANTYISRVLIQILPALAGSFFVAGVVSFCGKFQADIYQSLKSMVCILARITNASRGTVNAWRFQSQ